MIKAKDSLKKFVELQEDKSALCKRWNISRQTLYNILGGEDIGAETIAHILNDTGFDFEKAFQIGE